MIRYSTQPSKGTNALTDSPTAPIVTVKNKNNKGDQSNSALEDLDAEDNNE